MKRIKLQLTSFCSRPLYSNFLLSSMALRTKSLNLPVIVRNVWDPENKEVREGVWPKASKKWSRQRCECCECFKMHKWMWCRMSSQGTQSDYPTPRETTNTTIITVYPLHTTSPYVIIKKWREVFKMLFQEYFLSYVVTQVLAITLPSSYFTVGMMFLFWNPVLLLCQM